MNRMKKMLCALLAMVMVAGVCVIPTEARSDDDKVQALQALIDNAEEGAVITLEEDYQWSDGEPIEIPSGKNITLDLHGHTLESLDMFPVISVMSGAQLEIVNLSYNIGTIKNTWFEGWEQYYQEEWVGLFKVEENAKITLDEGYYISGYNMFTSDSAGEIIIEGGCFNIMPNGEYSIPEYTYLGEGYVGAGDNWHNYYYLFDAMRVSMNYDVTVPVGREVEFKMSVRNRADYPIENLDVQMGYATLIDEFTLGELVPFEDAVISEEYTIENGKVNIPKLEAGNGIAITFKGVIPEEMLGQEIYIKCEANIMKDGECVKPDWRAEKATLYQVTSDTQDSITEEEVSKPVDNVTVVKKQETEQAVGSETAKVVGNILSGGVSEEVVSTETATKVAEAIESGKSVKVEIVVKEMSTEEVKQITDTDKKAIEDKVATELGEDANLQYLDLSIMLKADDEELGTLNKLEEEITITVAIPEELKADGRTYKVIRNHNGVVELLDTVVNEDGTISFKTDRFSTYAIAYADKEETNTNPNPGTPSTDNIKDMNTSTNTNTNQSNKTPSTDSKAPQTGDNNLVMVYVVICLVALAAIVVTKRRKVFAK